jgi:signal transduction histidine kinase
VTDDKPEECLAGGGEMGALMRTTDWASTPLGPVERWPQSLRTAVSICLGTSFPMMIAWGPDLAMLYNDGYLPVLGTKKHPRALGQPLLECFHELRDQIGPMFRGVVDSGAAVGAEDMLFTLERHGYAEDTYFTFSYSPIRDESGRVGGVLTTCTETTQRVLGERRLRALRLLADAGARSQTVIEAVRAAADSLDPADVPFARIYLIEEGERRLVASVGDAAADAPSVELVIPRGVLVAGVAPRRPLDADYQSYFALIADHLATAIANARAHEEERRRAEQLAELDRAKTAFFSNVSHELRTPLTLILGPLEEALSGELPEAARTELEAVQRNARRLLKLVNTLLDFARIEAGRAEASYRPVELGGLTAELAGVFRSAIERAGLRLVVDCEPVSVFVDVEMWEKIVLNLLSNALKHTFDGEIAVALRARGERVELEVRDTGVGIAAEDVPRLFQRFHRVQGVRARSHEGSGIGLALVQDLVRLHGGEIVVESAVGAGTTFRVSLPAGAAHLPAERVGVGATASAFVEEALRWLPDSPPALVVAPGQRVLIADDNSDMRDYLRRILAPHWDVEAVADGNAALAAALRRAPDVVIADVMMPGLDGFALLGALRADERTREVPVLMLSARAGEEARIEALDAGVDDYMIKPFSARELQARLGALVVAARARERVERERASLHALFMQAPAPICILRSPRYRIELVNPPCAEVWQRPHDALIGRPLFEALPEIAGQGLEELLDGVRTTGTPHVGKELPVEVGPPGNRRTIYFNFVYAPLRDLDGRIDGVAVIAFDVTDEIRARDELARTVRLNETFAGVLGHDLRNPLNAIMTAAQLLQLRTNDERITGPVKRILSSGERMARMISQILDFARIRLAGGLQLDRRAVDLSEMIRRIVSEVEVANPTWRVEIDAVGDATGVWDEDRLAQVVSNLTGNAVQHGSPDSPLIVHVDGSDARAVALSFSNRGALPADLLPVLFDPFADAKSKRARARGLGLGLFITKEIVTAHGGEVAVSSVDDRVSFRVVLPRATAN